MGDRKKFLMVINPISGGVDKATLTEAALDYATQHKIEILKYETTGNDDQKAIRDLYEKYHFQRILVAGGDGTIKLVAEALEHQDVVLGILPAGSANGLSVDLNFPVEIEEILQIAFHNDWQEVDMIRINDQKSLHLSDIGLNAELIKNYENSSIRGKLGYALQAVNTLTDAELPFHAVVETKERKIETDAKMIVVANSQKYGTGVTINPFGKMNDGKFEIVIIKNLDLVVFGKIVTGNMPLDTGDVEIVSTDKAKITTDVPVHFQVDGEYCSEIDTLEIEIIPRQMKVAVPKA